MHFHPKAKKVLRLPAIFALDRFDSVRYEHLLIQLAECGASPGHRLELEHQRIIEQQDCHSESFEDY